MILRDLLANKPGWKVLPPPPEPIGQAAVQGRWLKFLLHHFLSLCQAPDGDLPFVTERLAVSIGPFHEVAQSAIIRDNERLKGIVRRCDAIQFAVAPGIATQVMSHGPAGGGVGVGETGEVVGAGGR